MLLSVVFIKAKSNKAKKKKKKKREAAAPARIELAGYLARVQQLTIENPVIPRNGALLMPLYNHHSLFLLYTIEKSKLKIKIRIPILRTTIPLDCFLTLRM